MSDENTNQNGEVNNTTPTPEAAPKVTPTPEAAPEVTPTPEAAPEVTPTPETVTTTQEIEAILTVPIYGIDDTTELNENEQFALFVKDEFNLIKFNDTTRTGCINQFHKLYSDNLKHIVFICFAIESIV